MSTVENFLTLPTIIGLKTHFTQCNKGKEQSKDQESIQSHLMGKAQNTRQYQKQENKDASPFTTDGCKEQTRHNDRQTRNPIKKGTEKETPPLRGQ